MIHQVGYVHGYGNNKILSTVRRKRDLRDLNIFICLSHKRS